MELKYTVRESKPSSPHKIVALYRTVASYSGGIARESNERTIEFYENSVSTFRAGLKTGSVTKPEDRKLTSLWAGLACMQAVGLNPF
ncbi:MAG TPA: hypothetical protein HA306_04215 [Methanosarcina sp.]|nr:hypothetical protein [Methanosarcina sp.]